MTDPNPILGDPKYRKEQLVIEGAWRFQMIAPLVDLTRPAAERAEVRRRLLSEKQPHPWRGLVAISARSLRRWCQAYHQDKIKGLTFESRSDRGSVRKLPEGALQRAKELYAEDSRRSTVCIIQLLAAEKPHWKTIARSTLGRHLRAAGLNRSSKPQLAYGKFVADAANLLWQGDIVHGPRVIFEKREVTAKIVCWLDDYSRYIVHIQAYENERLPAIESALTRAIAKHGKPRRILVDNGKVYSGKSLTLACSDLGIYKIHSRPYHPESKGKQERLFRTLRSQLLNEVENAPGLISLERLNRLLDAWRQNYHLTQHSELKCTPAQRFEGANIEPVSWELLEEAFLQWDVRKVSSQGIIDFGGQRYHAEPSLAGLQVIVRYDPFDLETIVLWREGRKIGQATPRVLINKTISRPPKSQELTESEAAERYLDNIEAGHLRRLQMEVNLIQLKEGDSNE